MNDPGAQHPGAQDRPQTWIGRAAPPRRAALPPASDPFWPPLEHQAELEHQADPYLADRPDPLAPPPLAPSRRTGRAVLLAVVGALAACCAGGATLALLGSAAVRHALSPAGSDRPGLNLPVRDGRFEFVVTSVGCAHDSVGRGVLARHPQGQYCIAEITVRNIGRDAQVFADSYQRAIAPDGTTYGADAGAGVIANGNLTMLFTSVNPGGRIAGKIVYDVPAGGRIGRLELHDSPLSRGVTVVVG